MRKSIFWIFCLFLSFVFGSSAFAQNSHFSIGIMQDEKEVAKHYSPLITYFKKHGVDVSMTPALTYPAAASMFRSGSVDAMFSGSAVAGIMIIKDLARPLVRPVAKDGVSTYWAVILAPGGSQKFDGSAGYFNKKRVAFCGLASAGEIFFHSIENISTTKARVMKSASHAAAIETLDKGFADIAIVKNRVWDKEKNKYPNISVVGKDIAENPENTLIVGNKTDPRLVAKVSEILLSLKNDNSPEADAVREQLDIKGYIKTTENDFKHTFKLLKKAGVNKTFNFAFADSAR